MERHTARYASFDSTRDSLPRVDGASAYRAAVPREPAGNQPRPSLRTLQLAVEKLLVKERGMGQPALDAAAEALHGHHR
jgi:hypothetical protein